MRKTLVYITREKNLLSYRVVGEYSRFSSHVVTGEDQHDTDNLQNRLDQGCEIKKPSGPNSYFRNRHKGQRR